MARMDGADGWRGWMARMDGADGFVGILVILLLFFGMEQLILKEESYRIIGACYKVHNTLGGGLYEKVYQEALSVEFMRSGIPFVREMPIRFSYDGYELNRKNYIDFLCFDKIILELKSLDYLSRKNERQLFSYLNATDKPLGFLINFGREKVQYQRFANTKTKKYIPY